jgi:alkylation response protein AidB-like acyl-CoA dehydrogenase
VAVRSGTPLEPGAGATARRWWRVAIATEVAGTAGAIVEFMLKFMIEREQFGRPLAAFQALQHRIVECYVLAQGVSWSAREAAFHNADGEKAAVASVLAVEAARQILQEAHQLSGAIGLTLEFDLHLWSTRLQALRVEMGGIGRHAEALVQERWS